MDIIENQQLWFDSALSYRTRLEKSTLLPMITHVQSSMSTLGLEVTDSIVFSVYEEISEPEQTILSVEFIVPVDKPFVSNCHYVFKPKFRLENAVLLKYSGNVSGLLDTRRQLKEYAIYNNFAALTNVYYSIKQLSGDNIVANAYMGVSGNSL